MRKYLLTDFERQVINTYLDTGEKSEAYRVVKSRILKLDLDRIKEDLELIIRFKRVRGGIQ
jgi:hypothetical protein